MSSRVMTYTAAAASLSRSGFFDTEVTSTFISSSRLSSVSSLGAVAAWEGAPAQTMVVVSVSNQTETTRTRQPIRTTTALAPRENVLRDAARGWAQAVMASSSPGDLLPVEYSSGCEEPVLVPCGSAFGLLRADDCFRPPLVPPCVGPLRTATGRPHGRRPWNGLCGQALSLLVSSPPRSPWRARALCPQRERKA